MCAYVRGFARNDRFIWYNKQSNVLIHKCSTDQEPNSMIMCSLNVKMEVTLLTYNMHKIGIYIIQAQSQENRNLADACDSPSLDSNQNSSVKFQIERSEAESTSRARWWSKEGWLSRTRWYGIPWWSRRRSESTRWWKGSWERIWVPPDDGRPISSIRQKTGYVCSLWVSCRISVTRCLSNCRISQNRIYAASCCGLCKAGIWRGCCLSSSNRCPRSTNTWILCTKTPVSWNAWILNINFKSLPHGWGVKFVSERKVWDFSCQLK